jgi:hypothetical protein
MGDGSAYPNLGFDPCPGSPESVSTLQQRITTASTSMREANDLLNRLRSDNSRCGRVRPAPRSGSTSTRR